ncbi:MAG: potassium channel family protein [bacterium]
MKKNLFIIIVGCGRLGSQISNTLSKKGHSVVIIDKNEDAFIHLSPGFSGFKVEGDGTQLRVLKDAKINRADVFIASTHNDNVNLMMSQIACKIFKIPYVLARIFDHHKEDIFSESEIITICPTSITSEIFIDTISKIVTESKGKKK